ncbi:MAG: VWA domain-containing protein [Rhizobiales bacterium]|nr:VWA domain-containing protein [Hyphomicrobiales bacterium]
MFRKFTNDTRGNVAPIFALSLIPVVGFVGAAIDYSRASATRTALQASLDSAALALSKEAAGLTAAQVTTKANQYVKATFNRPEATGLTITAAATTTPSTVTVTGTAKVGSDFMNLLGIPSLSVGSSSTVTWGSTKLRVALALDNTGSMADNGKIDALKTATKSLLTQLQTAATTPGDVQVSIVPFSKDVNIGKSNYLATWLDWTDWEKANGSNVCVGGTGSSCRNGKMVWTPDDRATWNGCVTDRGPSTKNYSKYNYDVNNTAPTSDALTKFIPEQYSYCTPAAVKTLSYDWIGMKQMVDSMEPNGATNQTIGLVMAWQTLTATAPFSPPALPPDTLPIIILMSDGMNTQNRWEGNGSSQSSGVDGRMKLACTNAKAAGMTIYTVQVNTGKDPLSTLLRDCATDSNKFFYLTSATQMVSTFNEIGTSLTKLRIAK